MPSALKTSESIFLRCSGCAQLLKVPLTDGGKTMSCPKCRGHTPIPMARETAATPFPQQAMARSTSLAGEQVTKNEGEQDAPEKEVGTTPGFRLRVDRETQIAELVTEIGAPPIRVESDIRRALKEEQISYGIDNNQVKLALLFLSIEEDFEPGQSFIVASGTMPIHGTDGRIDLTIDVSGQATFAAKDDGQIQSIDFKNATRIEVVNVGQKLGEIIPPTVGSPGFDLNGQRISARSGEFKTVTIGEGAKMGPDGRQFFATSQGRPIFEKGTISVAEVYDIEGNVDYSTGNIRFNGHVNVQGSVLDDFEIHCRSLEVHGTVGSARIQCDNDAVFQGGINGQGKGSLTIGGTCTAKYLNQVSARVDGHIRVERGITNCLIECLGEVVAERIVGGHALALLGFELNYLGSDLGVTTIVCPGQDYRVELLKTRLEALDDEILRLSSKAETWARKGAELDRLSDDAKASYEAAHAMTSKLGAEREEALSKRALLAEDKRQSIEMVNIGNQICNDVVVSNGQQSKEFKQTFSGTCTIRPAAETGYFEISTYARRPVKSEAGTLGEVPSPPNT